MTVLFAVLACVAAAVCASHIALVACARLAFMRKGRSRLTLDDVAQDRVLCFVVLAAFGVVGAGSFDLVFVPPSLALAYLLSGRVPQMIARRRRKELLRACEMQLDTMADVLSMGARAGLSFDASLSLYCAKFDGALARQMHDAQLKWETGLATRERALGDCASDLGSSQLQRLVDTVLQALQKGAPLADALAKLAVDLRTQRHNAMARKVEKAPVKMLIPTGTCILPAMLILVMGPMLIQFVQSGY